MLNSVFADWYFRLGSTNAAVSHYQLLNIPCPRFTAIDAPVSQALLDELETQLRRAIFRPSETSGSRWRRAKGARQLSSE